MEKVRSLLMEYFINIIQSDIILAFYYNPQTCLQIQMNVNNDIEWQKLVEWSESQNTYLIHLVASQQKLSIQIQDKHNGQIWFSQYTSQGIEDFTDKAKNKKKYNVFIHMVRLAIQKSKETLKLQILSYKQLSLRFGRTAAQLKNIPPEQASKRFFLLSYISDVEKMQFPLPVVHLTTPDLDRLKLTIRRLSQQNSLLRQSSQQAQVSKEINLLRYQNETLKCRLKSLGKNQIIGHSKQKFQQMQQLIQQKQILIENLTKKTHNLQSQNESFNQTIKQQQQKLSIYEKQLKQRNNSTADKRNHKQKQYESKLQLLINQMKELSQELQFARQNQRKSSIKIKTLEKQLQNMIANKRNKNSSIIQRKNSSPDSINERRSLSVKSGNSNKSNKSKGQNVLKNTNKNFNINNKKNSNKKSSVYDSDTQSSRMRKMNSGRSPYRQTNPAIFNNKKNSKPINERNRSKSKQQMTSPKMSNITSPQMYTEEQYYQSDDSQERLQRLQKKGQLLKNRKERQNTKKTTNKGNSEAKMNSSHQNGNHIENRFQILQEMIKKAAQSTKTKI